MVKHAAVDVVEVFMTWKTTYFDEGAENLWGHLERPLLLPIVLDLFSHGGVGLGDDGHLRAMALVAQLRSGEPQGIN